MSKHTPGPWKQGKTNQCNVSSNNALVCRTFNRGQYNTDSAEANARLIASAPDLLEALKIMTAHYCNLVRSGDAGNWEPDAEQEVMMAKAAIAKATGND